MLLVTSTIRFTTCFICSGSYSRQQRRVGESRPGNKVRGHH